MIVNGIDVAGMSPTDVLMSNTAEWMMIDRSLVSLTGTECDKIGVSYSGFRNAAVCAPKSPPCCPAARSPVLSQMQGVLPLCCSPSSLPSFSFFSLVEAEVSQRRQCNCR